VWQYKMPYCERGNIRYLFKKGDLVFGPITQTPETGTGSIINRDILSYHVTSVAEPCHFDTVPVQVPTSYPDPV
jgi:hypothetical protein